MTDVITYVTRMTGKRCYKTITHDELDAYDFPTPLFEVIKDDEYVHLYFDFDFKTADGVDFDDLYAIFTELKDTFGTFVVAGYCTDKTVHDRFNSYFKTHITLKNADFDKVVSMHVYYPEKRIARNELHTIMNSKHSLSRFIDTSVYKRRGKEQLFRHPYADKVEGDGKGCEIEEDASYLTVTCTGDEPIVTRAEWRKEFPLVMPTFEFPMPTPRAPTFEFPMPTPRAPTAESDLTFEVFEALYKGFDGLEIHGDVQNCDKEITLYPLLSALFASTNDVISDDAVWDAIDYIRAHAKLTPNAELKWDRILTAASKNTRCTGPGALFKYIKTFAPEYFNSTIKPLLPKRAEGLNDVDFDLKDSFSIGDIRSKGAAGGYQVNGDAAKLDYNAVLNDLRRCMLVVDRGEAIYVFKERDARNDRMTTNCYKDVPSERRLKQLKVGTEAKDDNKKNSKTVMRSAWDVYNASTNNAAFYKDAITFYSDKPNDFSFFQGYKYEEVQNDALIEAFNRHIKHIWCKDNEEYYTYVQDWFATIIQKPLGRARTAIVVKGIEGTGKNTITDAWCELLAGYANPNVSDMDSIAGKFNTSLENKKLLVCNEMNSVELSGANLHNSLKKLITEDYVDIHTKNVSVRSGVQNAANFVFLSNEFNPVKVTGTDRRYFIITPSEEVVGDDDYFDQLYDTMKDDDGKYRVEFMNALMYYYMNRTVSTNLKKIPETEEKKIMRDTNRPFTHYFIAAHMKQFQNVYGMTVGEAFALYANYYMTCGYGTKITRNKFIAACTAEFCTYTQIKQADGSRPRCLKLKTDSRFLKQLNELDVEPAGSVDCDE